MAWFQNSWTNRFKITSDNTKVSNANDNLYFDLANAPATFWTKTLTNTNTHSVDFEAGSNQYASITDAAQTGLNLSGDLTLECWMRLESAPNNHVLLAKWNATGDQRGYQFNFGGTGQLRLQVSSDGTAGTVDTYSVTPPISSGRLYHVAVSWDASTSTAKFYVNGKQYGGDQVGSETAIFDSSSEFEISGHNDGSARHFDGLMDEVRVWDAVRTAAQIRGNMFKELEGTETNLQGYWKLNNDYTDETSNNNDLTASGSPVFSTTTAFSNAGRDVRVTQSDGTTEVAHDVSDIDISGTTGALFLDSTGLSTSADTSWYVYYNNADATSYALDDTYGSDNVYSSDYKGVWHMDETGEIRFDRTSNTNYVDDNASVTSGTGKLETGADFEDGNNEYLNLEDDAQTGLDLSGDFSMSAWINPESLSGDHTIVSKGDIATPDIQYQFYVETNGKVALRVSDDGTNTDTHRILWEGTASDITTGTLQHVVVTFDISGESAVCYIDGSSVTFSKSAGTTIGASLNDSADDFLIGAHENTSITDHFDGILDEVRIRNDIVSANWVTTEYNNQNNSGAFWSVGLEEVTGRRIMSSGIF